MAEALLRHHLGADPTMPVASVGTIGWNGYPATPHAVEVLAERGIDLGSHISRKINRDDVDRSDLIIAMTRKHGWAVAAHDPEASTRTFVIGEVTRLAREQPRNGESLRDWAEAVARNRKPDRPMGQASDEIHDPIGESIEVYRATAAVLDRLLGELATAIKGD